MENLEECKKLIEKCSLYIEKIANVGKIGYLPEGAIACKYVHQIAQEKKLRLPMCDGLFRVLNKEVTVDGILKEILKQD